MYKAIHDSIFVRAKGQTQLSRLSIENWLSNRQRIHTVECYTAVRTRMVSTFTWSDPQDVRSDQSSGGQGVSCSVQLSIQERGTTNIIRYVHTTIYVPAHVRKQIMKSHRKINHTYRGRVEMSWRDQG